MTTNNKFHPGWVLIVIALLAGCNRQTVHPDTASSPPPPPATPTPPEPAPPPTQAEQDQDNAPKQAEVVPVTDLWERIRNGFRLPGREHKRVLREQGWFQKHQDYLDRVAQRAEPILFHIVEQVESRGMPLEIALLPVVESAFQPFAYSHGRAAGIWQFIPSTGRLYGLKQNWWYDGRRDLIASTNAALDYLQKLHKEFDGDWLLALAAYNSGEGTVARAVRKNRRRGRPTDFWSLDLPRETRAYVPRLLAITELVDHPNRYGLTWHPIANEPKVAQVDIGGQIDLALAADMAGITLEELYTLNPAFNRWATSPDGPHRLLLPLDRIGGFVEKLAALPDEKRIHWQRYRIRRGDSLGVIARRFGTTVAVLRKVNHLRGNHIRAGRHLLIPQSSSPLADYTLSAEQRSRRTIAAKGKGTKRIHTVSRGESLWSISRKYGVGVKTLARWNAMGTRDTLHPGRKLVVWTRKNSGATDTAASSFIRATHNPARVQTVVYTVRRGDSLYRISQRFRVSIADLRRWNRLGKGKLLKPGQKLRVKVDITRQSS